MTLGDANSISLNLADNQLLLIHQVVWQQMEEVGPSGQ